MKKFLKIFLWLAVGFAAVLVLFGLAVVGLHASVDLREPDFTPDPGRAEYHDSLRV